MSDHDHEPADAGDDEHCPPDLLEVHEAIAWLAAVEAEES